ncbi:hypothetical protein EXN66_Car018690 [Channa argus]|uniref:Uncharacterized protein n=1 Tax=Channa argus TaxID=215402 RepID=A0A6G1QKC6_CHAAH|nr:hypothetical protein EXN66_Car018690 [Channa argus]
MPAADAILLSSGALIRPLVIKRRTDRGSSSFARANSSAVPNAEGNCPGSSTAQIAPHD